jgi:polar amino acid transport system permease protein
MTFSNITIDMLNGFKENLYLFCMTLIFSLPLGLLISFAAISKFKPLRILIKIFVWCIRGTPLMLQLFIVMYVPGILFDFPVQSRMTAALIAFVINYAAYFSEIYRSGIQGISKGQFEAGYALGLSRTQVFEKVIFIQVIRLIIPPMSNEIITLVKDTALARVISVAELIMTAERYAGRGLLWPLFYTGIFFLVFTAFLTVLFGKIEKKLAYCKT